MAGKHLSNDDLIPGFKRGQLKVLASPETMKGTTYVLCECDCGVVKYIRSYDIRRGDGQHNVTCGHTKNLPNFGAQKNRIYNEYKKSAKKKGLEFNIPKPHFLKLLEQNCFYCNVEPSNTYKTKSDEKEDFKYNGLDRVDSTKGYIIGNVRPSCASCNKAKLVMSQTDFFEWVKTVYTNLLAKKLIND